MSAEAETTSATTTPVTPTKAAGAPGSAASTPSKETDEALAQLVQGRRHLLVKDYFSAVAALAKACELLAVKYGDTAPECGDAYLTYGKALLELARSESGVLGLNKESRLLGLNEGDKSDEDADGEGEGEADGDDEEEEGDEEGSDEAKDEAKDGEEEKKVNRVEENGEDAEKGKDKTIENGKKTKNGGKAKNGDVKPEYGVKGAEKGVKESKEGEGESKEEDEDDEKNLQLAWEMLEQAKVIFEKQLETGAGKHVALRLAEVYFMLGEVDVELENYSTAIEDMKSCLELQRTHLEDDDRRIAETLYNMGMAYSLANEFDAAIEQFKLASEQIEKRISCLEKERSDPSNIFAHDDLFGTYQGDIDDLKALLPGIENKVTDMQDFKKGNVHRMMDGLVEKSARDSSTADGACPSSASDKPVSSVAHLIKRKPKDEAAGNADETAVKTETAEVSQKTEETDSEVGENRKRKQEGTTESGDPSKKVKVEEN